MESKNIFYTRLKEECKKRNLSINQLERNLGYPRNALNNYQVTDHCPSGIRLIEIADYFDVSPKYLLGLLEKESHLDAINYFNGLETEEKKKIILVSQEWLINCCISGNS